MQSILDYLFWAFSSFSPAVLFLLVIFFGLYVYWRGSMETRKNASSVFDIFLLSILGGLIAGRIIYVLSNWGDFSQTVWWWLPYERYGDQVYLFRLLPWKFLNIFDGGLDILVMFVAYLLSSSFLSSFVKRWSWKDTFPTIFFSGETMLSFSFLLLGLSNQNTTWLYEGLILLISPVISIILITYVNKIQKPQRERKIYLWANVLLSTLTGSGVGYIYLSGGLDIFEKVTVIIFLVWVAIGVLVFFLVARKTENIVIEKVSSVRSIEVGSPVKLSK